MYIPQILIVDDQEVDRETLRNLLLSENYDCTFAGSGAEAFRKAAQLKPDLIFLDVMMPDQDGFEVCRKMRDDPTLAEVPIIMVTSLDDRASRLRGIEAGADDFVTKPFDGVELRARARAIIRLNRYRRLLAERSKFEWVVNRAKDGYLIVNGNDQILYANTLARLYLGLPLDPNAPLSETFSALAQKQYQRKPGGTWDNWRAAARYSADTEAPSLYLVRPETATARAFWLGVNVLELPIGAENNWLVHLRDVTNQMKLQRDISGFHRAVKHKLRTPLGGILGGFELLQDFETMSNAEIRDMVELGLRNARRLCDEINDILVYTDALDLPQHKARFHLAELGSLVSRVSVDLKLEFVSIFCPDELSNEHIMLSPQSVELVFTELLENTQRFHPEHNPQVEVAISRANTDKISLRITDDGRILSPEQLKHIWSPYYQAEKNFTGEAPGMGLGLSTVAALVWGVGGRCRAYNRDDGQGIVVELIVPLALPGERRDAILLT